MAGPYARQAAGSCKGQLRTPRSLLHVARKEIGAASGGRPQSPDTEVGARRTDSRPRNRGRRAESLAYRQAGKWATLTYLLLVSTLAPAAAPHIVAASAKDRRLEKRWIQRAIHRVRRRPARPADIAHGGERPTVGVPPRAPRTARTKRVSAVSGRTNQVIAAPNAETAACSVASSTTYAAYAR